MCLDKIEQGGAKAVLSMYLLFWGISLGFIGAVLLLVTSGFLKEAPAANENLPTQNNGTTPTPSGVSPTPSSITPTPGGVTPTQGGVTPTPTEEDKEKMLL